MDPRLREDDMNNIHFMKKFLSISTIVLVATGFCIAGFFLFSKDKSIAISPRMAGLAVNSASYGDLSNSDAVQATSSEGSSTNAVMKISGSDFRRSRRLRIRHPL